MHILQDFRIRVEPRRRFTLALFSAPAPPDEMPDNVVPIERADWLGGRDFGRFAVEWISGLTLTQLRVALALAAHASKASGECWVSRARICAFTGSDVADVKRALRALERLGIIERLGLKRGVGHYRLHRGGRFTPGGTSTPEHGGSRTPTARGATPAREPTRSNQPVEQTQFPTGTRLTASAAAASADISTTKKPSPARARTREAPTPADRGVAAILDAAWAEISKNLPQLTLTEKSWKLREEPGAFKLWGQGHSPAQVAELLEMAHTHPDAGSTWRDLNSLGDLAACWLRAAKINAATDTRREISAKTQALF